MGYKNIMISSSAQLRIKDGQLLIIHSDTFSIPLEDVNCVMLESHQIMISSYLLSQFSHYGIAVYFCDEKHTPNSVLLPLVRHSRHLKMLKEQLNLGRPQQKRLWQQIIIMKIQNQARCLELLEKDGAKELYALAKQVQSGDRTNCEAQAASFYFPRLVSENFIRRADDYINAAMDYGYSLIRSLIARTIIMYGYEPSLGLFHHSELNSFNLADDLFEPFRPLVDLYILKYFDTSYEGNLSSADKKILFQLLNFDMDVEGEHHSISNCVDKLVSSFSSVLNEKRQDLWLPKLIPLQVHRYE